MTWGRVNEIRIFIFVWTIPAAQDLLESECVLQSAVTLVDGAERERESARLPSDFIVMDMDLWFYGLGSERNSQRERDEEKETKRIEREGEDLKKIAMSAGCALWQCLAWSVCQGSRAARYGRSLDTDGLAGREKAQYWQGAKLQTHPSVWPLCLSVGENRTDFRLMDSSVYKNRDVW